MTMYKYYNIQPEIMSGIVKILNEKFNSKNSHNLKLSSDNPEIIRFIKDYTDAYLKYNA